MIIELWSMIQEAAADTDVWLFLMLGMNCWMISTARGEIKLLPASNLTQFHETELGDAWWSNDL